MYVCINKDLEKLLACEQISHPRPPKSPRRVCWQANKITTTLQLCGPWGLCVLQKCGNYYSLILCISTGNYGRVDQFTLEGCFTRKTVNKLQKERCSNNCDISMIEFKSKEPLNTIGQREY